MNMSSRWIHFGNRSLHKLFIEHFKRSGESKTHRLTVFNLVNKNYSSEVDKANKSQFDGKVTVFDKIISREIPADVIYEDDVCMAFNDMNPQAPTHFLVIPKKRIARLNDVDSTDQAVLGHLILTSTKLAKSRLKNGFRLVVNDGQDGAQSVYHLHIHVLGGRQMNWPPG